MVKRKIMIEDLRKFKFLSDPQISHDGSHIAFVLSTINIEEDKYDRHIWMANTKTGEKSQFTYGVGSDTNPRWSPDDSKLLFVSKGREPDKKSQLYTINVSGGEAALMSESEEGISTPQWSSDGKSLLYITKVWTEKKPETDVKVVKRIKYKLNGTGFFEGRRSHVFVVSGNRKPKQLTNGEYDVDYAIWNPNGKEFAFVTNMQQDQDTSKVRDIYVSKLRDGEMRKITKGSHAIGSFSYSPNGRTLAFIGYGRLGEYAVDYDIYLIPSDGGEVKCITEGFDRSLGMSVGSDLRVATPSADPVWDSNGTHIYFLTTDTPYCNIYRIDTDTRKLDVIVSGKTVDGYSISDDGTKIAYNAMTAIEPCELYLMVRETSKLTRFNEQLLKQVNIIEPEHFTFTNRLGKIVDSWIIKPHSFEPGKKYPCVLEVHGGPRGSYGDTIFHEFQVLASMGWAVIYTNPRGSSGYEEDFTMAVMKHYGKVDYEDFMDFTDEAIRRFPWIDKDRLGLTGGSYGGYTTNWIITQTNRFRAAVTFRSICNWVSKFGVSDIGYTQPETISGEKTYWGQALLEQMKHSPLYYVDRVTTPCLIVHSEQDYRCPIEQGEQWFTALKLNGVPTELVRFPDENHELSRSGKPKHREERLQHMVRWFEAYL
jgi:dipeptidyl aminopeptidase/acylaminoacyl peptidase